MLRFARSNFTVAFSYHRNRSASDETLKLIEEMGANGFYIQMDVSSESSVKRGFDEVSRRIPYLNVLVNNAGAVFFGTIDETRLEDWERGLLGLI
ncbi:MAG: SDR family NAD(P)-dependent oxidoreductase [archaeon GB-1867-005]|nr:SDR family NAD(P)-dependent oxidoreductase [Candidatus Culexmicrobium cathedralense]